MCASGLLVHTAASTGVEGHAVCVLVMDAFDDVDLTLVWPVVASRPAESMSVSIEAAGPSDRLTTRAMSRKSHLAYEPNQR